MVAVYGAEMCCYVQNSLSVKVQCKQREMFIIIIIIISKHDKCSQIHWLSTFLFKAVILGDLMVIWASLCRENKIKLQPGFVLFCFFSL